MYVTLIYCPSKLFLSSNVNDRSGLFVYNLVNTHLSVCSLDQLFANEV